ncbi:L-lactate permease [Blastococcus sp. PRF04-17]|uniref:L-lactate permease n=1 Tax=Blastococcus sp. PRF04-17 TaxID=2933797 RepID=UPI001FF4E2AA|nr:L-lactate permease [Blastococcus sp. PRF04-17]UOX99978.1 L-lactate permease [Blastococcus sp. PRF04-17]
MRAVLAVAPIVAVLTLMVGLRWSAARSGLLAAVGTLALALLAFGFGGPGRPYTPALGTVGLLAEAGFLTLTVVAIIGPALAIHHLQQCTGATDALRAGLGRLTPDPRIAALLLAWFFPLFLEGAAGFGTPVALAAPFLVAAGFRPLLAVTAALIGHAAGVSFGALGTPVVAQVAATGFSGAELARATAPYHALLGWVLAAAVVLVIGRAVPGRPAPWAWGALAAAAFLVPYGLIGWFVGPELPTIGAALLGGLVFVAVVRMARAGGAGHGESQQPVQAPPAMSPLRAAAPYLALVAVVLITRLVPPVRDVLVGVIVDWELFGAFTGSVRPLYHPGLLLPMAFAIGALAQGASGADVRRAVGNTNRMLLPVVVALMAMVTIARTMSQSGMTDELAVTAAGVGAGWPLLAPAVGALGTFVTGSATASNILFTDFQQATAEAQGRPVLPLLGAQGFGAAVGNIICPHNVVAAAATVGLSRQEGEVLRRTLPLTVGYVALGGVLAWWFTR